MDAKPIRMNKYNYNIYVGLGGSFGGANYVGTIYATEDEAYKLAIELGNEEFETYSFHFEDDMQQLHDDLITEGFKEGSDEWIDAWDEGVATIREDWVEAYIIEAEEDEETDLEDTFEIDF